MIRIPYILVDTSARLGVEMEYNFFFFFLLEMSAWYEGKIWSEEEDDQIGWTGVGIWVR